MKKKQAPDVSPTPEVELQILESELKRTASALKAKREQLSQRNDATLRREELIKRATLTEADKERFSFVQAFKLGDDLDNERAIRAAALILDWISGDGGDPVEGTISNGLSQFLCEVADRIASEQERAKRLRAKGWTEEEIAN